MKNETRNSTSCWKREGDPWFATSTTGVDVAVTGMTAGVPVGVEVAGMDVSVGVAVLTGSGVFTGAETRRMPGATQSALSPSESPSEETLRMNLTR